eukprot:350677-Chlamydomonas_euryale.AAC.3
MLSSAIRGCHEEGGGTTFRDFLKLSDVQATAAERALDRQAWRNAVQSLATLEFKRHPQIGRIARSSARCGGSGRRCATLSDVRPAAKECC